MAKSRTRTRHLRVRAIWYFGQYQRASAGIFPVGPAVSFWAAVAARAQVPGVRPAEKCPGIPEPSCCPRCSGEPGWRRCAGGHESRLRQSVRFKTGGAYAECCPERCGRRRERGSSKGRLPAFFRCCFRTWTASSSGGKVQDYRWPLPAGRRIRHFARCPAASADTAQVPAGFYRFRLAGIFIFPVSVRSLYPIRTPHPHLRSTPPKRAGARLRGLLRAIRSHNFVPPESAHHIGAVPVFRARRYGIL